MDVRIAVVTGMDERRGGKIGVRATDDAVIDCHVAISIARGWHEPLRERERLGHEARRMDRIPTAILQFEEVGTEEFEFDGSAQPVGDAAGELWGNGVRNPFAGQ